MSRSPGPRPAVHPRRFGERLTGIVTSLVGTAIV